MNVRVKHESINGKPIDVEILDYTEAAGANGQCFSCALRGPLVRCFDCNDEEETTEFFNEDEEPRNWWELSDE